MAGRRLAAALNIIVWFLIIMDIIFAVSSPWWIDLFTIDLLDSAMLRGYIYNMELRGSYVFLVSFTIYCGIFLACILYQISVILNSIAKSNPYTKKNAVSFKLASVFSLFLVMAFIFKMFVAPTILTLLCVGGITIFGLFLLVLAELFAYAAKIKEENELTI